MGKKARRRQRATMNEMQGMVAEQLDYFKDEQKIKFRFDKKQYSFSTKLIGKVQIKNLLMAIMAAMKSKISLEKILKIIPKIKSVNGRLEKGIKDISKNSNINLKLIGCLVLPFLLGFLS